MSLYNDTDHNSNDSDFDEVVEPFNDLNDSSDDLSETDESLYPEIGDSFDEKGFDQDEFELDTPVHQAYPLYDPVGDWFESLYMEELVVEQLVHSM